MYFISSALSKCPFFNPISKGVKEYAYGTESAKSAVNTTWELIPYPSAGDHFIFIPFAIRTAINEEIRGVMLGWDKTNYNRNHNRMMSKRKIHNKKCQISLCKQSILYKVLSESQVHTNTEVVCSRVRYLAPFNISGTLIVLKHQLCTWYPSAGHRGHCITFPKICRIQIAELDTF